MADKLEIAVSCPPREAGETDATITVRARNRSARPVQVIGCVLLFPMGLRVSADEPALSYPVSLAGGDSCTEGFSSATLARLARQAGYASRVTLTAIVLEDGGFDESVALRLPSPLRSARGVEHRSDPFVFDAGL